jgi:hypothetical protein
MTSFRATDPRHYIADYEVATDAFLAVDVDEALLARAPFLDRRLEVDWNGAIRVNAATVPAPQVAPPAFVFHTAFCCSTLLARALDAPPRVVALKEPLALMSLSQASLDDAFARERLDDRLHRALALLARPWSDGGRVLVKPTNLVNRLLPRILAVAPTARAVLLHSSLREFLVSCCKKLPQAETRIRWMANHLLPGSPLARTLGVDPAQPFNFVEACVLTWYAQMELFGMALARDGGQRLASLDMDALLAEPARTVAAAARWLGLDAALDGVDERVAREFSRHAKATDEPFDPAARASEKARVLARWGDLIDQAEAWARQAVEPAAQMPWQWHALAVADGGRSRPVGSYDAIRSPQAPRCAWHAPSATPAPRRRAGTRAARPRARARRSRRGTPRSAGIPAASPRRRPRAARRARPCRGSARRD